MGLLIGMPEAIGALTDRVEALDGLVSRVRNLERREREEVSASFPVTTQRFSSLNVVSIGLVSGVTFCRMELFT